MHPSIEFVLAIGTICFVYFYAIGLLKGIYHLRVLIRKCYKVLK